MTALLWVIMIVSGLGAVCQGIYLSRMDYPRILEYSATEDVFNLFVELGPCLWSAYLLLY